MEKRPFFSHSMSIIAVMTGASALKKNWIGTPLWPCSGRNSQAISSSLSPEVQTPYLPLGARSTSSPKLLDCINDNVTPCACDWQRAQTWPVFGFQTLNPCVESSLTSTNLASPKLDRLPGWPQITRYPSRLLCLATTSNAMFPSPSSTLKPPSTSRTKSVVCIFCGTTNLPSRNHGASGTGGSWHAKLCSEFWLPEFLTNESTRRSSLAPRLVEARM
mmetsp:Transcript_16413/g.36259  ORF Transcript_16413/g.36259 Transcript_16413/m.36259 type:complete len:218 (+) Transcript_16413:213-866(+)